MYDHSTGITQYQEFNQTFPYIGQSTQSASSGYQASDNSGQPINSLTHTQLNLRSAARFAAGQRLAHTVNTFDRKPLNSGKTTFAYLKTSTTTARALPANGGRVAQVSTTTNTYGDSYGNLTRSVT